MDLSRLTERQKRALFWESFLKGESVDADTRRRIEGALREYRACIVHCWEHELVGPQEEQKLSDLERTLEDLNERVRLKGGVNG